MKTKFPTERKILKYIADMYESSFPGSKPGENDPYLEIDVTSVAEQIGCKPQLLFGYLYYFLDHKHRYQTGENTWTHLFALQVGSKKHCVNYPYLAGILASHEVEHRRNLWSLITSMAALVLSLAAIIAQVITSGGV